MNKINCLIFRIQNFIELNDSVPNNWNNVCIRGGCAAGTIPGISAKPGARQRMEKDITRSIRTIDK